MDAIKKVRGRQGYIGVVILQERPLPTFYAIESSALFNTA